MKFGELKRIPLRDIWQNEARDFTPWLADNMHAIGEALGLDLELLKREADAGEFSLDLLAKDLGSGKKVVIENQIQQTDHDHSGKLLTYASAFDAGVVVWISETIREEHRQALEWLNQRTDEDTQIFGVIVEVLQIDESAPAYHFQPVVFPNEWRKKKRTSAGGVSVSARAESYRMFFQNLIDELRDTHRFTNARIGQPQNWYSFASGISGITYGTVFAKNHRVRVELYIDFTDGSKNLELFDALNQQKEEIEQELGNNLEWERLDTRRASRIALYNEGSIDMPEDKLDEIREWAVTKILGFKEVFGPRIQEILAI